MNILDFKSSRYVDYSAKQALTRSGYSNLAFDTKVVSVDGKPTVIAVLDGMADDGAFLGNDLWPVHEATESDIVNVPMVIDDVIFRIGYYTYIGVDGKEKTITGKPKWVALVSGGKRFKLSGDKREFTGTDVEEDVIS